MPPRRSTCVLCDGTFPLVRSAHDKAAEDAWRSAAQRTVDDAEMKYVVVHLHRLLDPEAEGVKL